MIIRAYMRGTHKHVIVGFSSNAGVDIPFRPRANNPVLCRSVPFRLRRDLVTRIDKDDIVWRIARFCRPWVSQELGRQPEVWRRNMTPVEPVEGSLRSTEATRAGWISGCLLGGGDNTGAFAQ